MWTPLGLGSATLFLELFSRPHLTPLSPTQLTCRPSYPSVWAQRLSFSIIQRERGPLEGIISISFILDDLYFISTSCNSWVFYSILHSFSRWNALVFSQEDSCFLKRTRLGVRKAAVLLTRFASCWHASLAVDSFGKAGHLYIIHRPLSRFLSLLRFRWYVSRSQLYYCILTTASLLLHFDCGVIESWQRGKWIWPQNLVAEEKS